MPRRPTPRGEGGGPPESSLRGAKRDAAISREEIARRVEADLEAQLKEIQPPPNELFKKLWHRVLEIKHNPELTREQKERAIAEAKLQSLVGHRPAVHATPHDFESILHDGITIAAHRKERGSFDGWSDPNVIYMVAFAAVIHSIEKNVGKGSKLTLRERKMKWVDANFYENMRVWGVPPGIGVNMDEFDDSIEIREDVTGHGTGEYLIHTSQINPAYFRFFMEGPMRGYYNSEQILDIQRKIFGDSLEYMCPILYGNIVLWPPPEEGGEKKSSEK